MSLSFRVGDYVSPKRTDTPSGVSMIRKYGDPPWRVTSIEGNFVRVNNWGSGYPSQSYVLSSLENVELVFIEPIARTTQGVIYKSPKNRKLYISTSGTYVELGEKQTQQVQEYLNNKTPFEEELFTL